MSVVAPVLFGSIGGPNIGDEAICLTWMEHYLREYNCRDFRIVSLSTNNVDRIFKDDVRFSARADDKLFWFIYDAMAKGQQDYEILAALENGEGGVLAEIEQLLEGATHLHVIGGGYLGNQSTNIAIMLSFMRWVTDRRDLPVIFTGISFGHHRDSSFIREDLFRAQDWFDFRDETGEAHFRAENMLTSCDDFLMSSDTFQVKDAVSQPPYAAICLPGILPDLLGQEVWQKLVTRVISLSEVLTRDHGVESIYVVSSCFGDDDWRFGRDFLERGQARQFWTTTKLVDMSLEHPARVKRFLRDARAVIAGRFHFTLMSALQGTPTIAFETSAKIMSLRKFLPSVRFATLETDEPADRVVSQAFSLAEAQRGATMSAVHAARLKKTMFHRGFINHYVDFGA